jgi:plastocyanin
VDKSALWKHRRIAVSAALVPLVAGAVLLATTAEARNQPAPDATERAANLAQHAVTARDFSFAPNQLINLVNDPATVVVTNSGAAPHTFTIQGLVDSGSIAPGQSRTVQFTPTTAGDLTFFCTIHGQNVMNGRISIMNPATNPVQPSQQQPAPQQPQTVPQQPQQTSPAPPPPPRPVIMQPPSTGDAGLLALQTD